MPADNSRRTFLKSSAAAIATSAAIAPKAYASSSNTTQVAIVGCGGRGTGAVRNALKVEGPVKLVSMADVFEKNLKNSYGNLAKVFKNQPERLDVAEECKFIGFDAYKKAMDLLSPGDIVILTTPAAFRWLHYSYAIEKNLNVFMEKPVTIDGPGSRKMLEVNKKAIEKNLKVGVGLMCRHCDARRELFDRIQNGEIGDINMLRAYRMAGPTGSAETGKKPEGISDLMYQIKRFHAFLWLSGGAVSDFLIHNIDESCWMKNDWPIEAKASGGRHYRGDYVDQNFDTYSIEYTFRDGAKLLVNGRTMPGCYREFASYAHGTKGMAVISTSSHSPAKCRIYKGQNEDKENLLWAYPKKEKSPYQLEWDHLIDAVRNDKPYNEVERGVKASLVTSMGRMAAHTGQVITYDEMLNCEHNMAPGIETLTKDSDSPLMPREDGTYPIPYPGLVKDQEYL
ncbi:MAG: Gfo/Idh/MocA family protein [Planctomycetaceae bacterium]